MNKKAVPVCKMGWLEFLSSGYFISDGLTVSLYDKPVQVCHIYLRTYAFSERNGVNMSS